MRSLRSRHIWILSMAALSLLFHLLAFSRRVMNAISSGTLPLRQTLSRACALFPFSAAELLCTLGVLGVLVWLVWTAASVLKSRKRWSVLWRRVSLLLAIVLTLYLLLCLLLGASYRADGFQEKSGLIAQPESAETLAETTTLFARRLRETAETVARTDTGEYAVPLELVFGEAEMIYRGAEERFPFLRLRDVTPKQAFYSRLMSRFNYTGFYFPFTGEANINTDPPGALIPATIAHEMAHQRGIASEQEANFVSILACTESGSPAYAYSGWLFGFIHLGNALYRWDPDAYWEIAASLPEEVWADLRANDAYWAQFETKAAEVSNAVYDTMLKSYGQSLGVRSYGAVVDLLLAWYLRGGFEDNA
ncbi:MAG: DUF3810 domain-containing protein [Oscillospiraceae bacterium]|nr:DUF3810 domain-containing protein [Oscillospiraceae bacterium]